MQENKFKLCCRCKLSLSMEKFYASKSSKDGKQSICTECVTKNNEKYYLKNKNKIKINTKERKEKFRTVIQKFVLLRLKDGCICCGEKDPVVLDFDHLQNKEYNIAWLVNSLAPLSKLEKELDKCQVLCANCHRRKTTKDFNWWKHKSTK